MYCICCKKNNVVPMEVETRDQNSNSVAKNSEEDILWKKEKSRDQAFTINNEMVNGGIIHIIEAGYGSKHDGGQIIISICDDCIKENLEDATLLYFGDYMNAGQSFVEEEIEKSKKKYRRRKNLDGLV
jgi:hypothetical protein